MNTFALRFSLRPWPFAAAAGLLLFDGCSPNTPQSSGAGRAAPAVPVLVARVESKDVPVNINSVGNVQAFSTVTVRSQITGPIAEVHFREGQEVAAGDLLFTIDPRPWQAALNQAEANLRRDEALLLSAHLDFQRTSNLFESKIASQHDFEAAESNYRALEATTLADQAAITNAQVSLSYTSIRAPIDGRTGNLTFKEGNLVKASDDCLLTITRIHPIYVGFSVPEHHLSAIRRESIAHALPVDVAFPSEKIPSVRGALTFIDNMVDTNSGMIFLKATFDNTDNQLWPGQFVQVSLTVSNLARASVVPSQAVQTSQNGEFVFVIQSDETAAARPVVSGINYQGLTVIESGLEPGETVVTDGQLRLVPGAKVSIKSTETNGPAPTTASGSTL